MENLSLSFLSGMKSFDKLSCVVLFKLLTFKSECSTQVGHWSSVTGNWPVVKENPQFILYFDNLTSPTKNKKPVKWKLYPWNPLDISSFSYHFELLKVLFQLKYYYKLSNQGMVWSLWHDYLH